MKTGSQNTPPSGNNPSGQASDAYAGAAQNAGQNNANYQTPPPQQAAPVGGAPRAGGIGALLSRGRIGGLPQNGGRDVAELTKKFQDYYESQKTTELSGVNIRIVPATRGSIIGAENNLSNAIGLVLFIVEGSDNRVAYHSLLVASDMSPTAPTRTNEMYGTYAQEQVTAPRTTATLADDALAKVIMQRVGQLAPQSRLFSADWSTVPVNFKMNDPVAVATLFLNALRACWTELETKTAGFQYDSLSSVAGDGILVNSVHFNQDQVNPPIEAYDPAGLPIRGEVVAAFRSEQPRTTNQRDQTENTAGVMELGTTLASITLNIDPVPGRANRYMGMPAQQGAEATQEYSAEVTLTGFDMRLTPDLGNVLLQLSTILAVLNSQERPWLRNYLPRHLQMNGASPTRNDNFRPRDLGALNYDYGLKTTRPDGSGIQEVLPFPTTNQNEFGIENYYHLVNAIIQAAPALSIDVPLAGAETWFLRIFAEASEVPEAYQAIVKAMDALTDGRFSQKFFTPQSSRLIVLPRSERVLNGFFTDNDGRQHDLRVVDLLYLMNAKGHEDPEIGRRWAATFGGSNDAQLAARLKLIESAVHNVTVTGISIHKTYHPDFLRAMDESINETGLRPRIDIAQQDNRMAMRTPYGLAQAGALNTGFVPTMFQNGPAYAGGAQAGYRGMAHTRVY
jgi:hypothetical protein